MIYPQEEEAKNYEDRENMFFLKPYTLFFEITNRFGEYDEAVGSGWNIVQYKLPDGRKLELNFGGGNNKARSGDTRN